MYIHVQINLLVFSKKVRQVRFMHSFILLANVHVWALRFCGHVRIRACCHLLQSTSTYVHARGCVHIWTGLYMYVCIYIYGRMVSIQLPKYIGSTKMDFSLKTLKVDAHSSKKNISQLHMLVCRGLVLNISFFCRIFFLHVHTCAGISAKQRSATIFVIYVRIQYETMCNRVLVVYQNSCENSLQLYRQCLQHWRYDVFPPSLFIQLDTPCVHNLCWQRAPCRYRCSTDKRLLTDPFPAVVGASRLC